MGPLDPGAAYSTFFCTVFGFGLFVVYSARHEPFHRLLHPDASFLSARKEVSWFFLGLSLYASFMGNWVLFLPPITGALYSWAGITGYALSSSIPYLLLAWFSPIVCTSTKEGFCSCDHLGARFGRVAQLAAAAVSLCFMLVTLASELTTVGMSMSALSGGSFPSPCSVILVAAVPLAYVLLGGLKCCIISDVVQAIVIVFLFLPFVVYLICTGVPLETEPPTAILASPVSLKEGILAGAVLLLSVWPVFLSDQGVWQRVWAARSPRDIRLAFFLAALLSGVSVFLFGVAGKVCLSSAAAQQGASLFSYSALHLPVGWLVLLCVLALTCVTSSVDTYQAALVSLIARDLEKYGLSFNWARAAMVVLNIPAVMVALHQVSLLSLFMISNFLCAVLAGPFLVSVHPKLTTAGFLGGLVCALVGLLLCGVCTAAAQHTRFSFAFFAPSDISTVPYAISFAVIPLIGAGAAAIISYLQRRLCPAAAAAAGGAAPPLESIKGDMVEIATSEACNSKTSNRHAAEEEGTAAAATATAAAAPAAIAAPDSTSDPGCSPSLSDANPSPAICAVAVERDPAPVKV
ncbi:hypothetical protein ACSSS7_003092 [Eimeria intestinalis]